MKNPTITKENVDVDVSDEIMSFGLKAGTVAGALIGIWAVSCLLVALLSAGPVAMVRGYITAITGL